MIYTDMTKKALKLSFEAHKDQKDKSGMPYVYHPFHLAEQMKTENETVVALLHDVIEDTQYTIDDIRAMGFSDEVTDALALMTHDESVSYMDYVAKIKENSIASAVKLADLRHNSDLSRLDNVDDKAIRRIQKYADAIELLTGEKPGTRNLYFFCYGNRNVSFDGKIVDGCLHLVSIITDDIESEAHFTFSREETARLFSIISLNEFIDLCRAKHMTGMRKFLKDNGIEFQSMVV